jgi:hypothetical protein
MYVITVTVPLRVWKLGQIFYVCIVLCWTDFFVSVVSNGPSNNISDGFWSIVLGMGHCFGSCNTHYRDSYNTVHDNCSDNQAIHAGNVCLMISARTLQFIGYPVRSITRKILILSTQAFV